MKSTINIDYPMLKTSPALVFFNANYHLANCYLAIFKLSDQLLTEPEGLSICYDSNDDCY